ncbi:MAG TPA: ADP-ribosylglycohydrolase family protein [Acetobacteraceae bacterium]|nr:ADP-ribosylglycohydrolase family protein [Acetobacteraceae bacterium]
MSDNVEAEAQWAERVLGVRISLAAPVIGTQRLAQQPAARQRPGVMPPLPAAPTPSPAPETPTQPALSPAAARDRSVGCLLGLAIGDAVGATAEFKPRGSFPTLTDLTGGGQFRLAAGEWTDDATMALCLG